MDTSDDWIIERTGIKERRFIKKILLKEQPQWHVMHQKIAISNAGIKNSDIELVIFSTLSPDYFFLGQVVIFQDMMNLGTCPALDIRNQCSGFIYGLSVKDQFIKTGMYKNILLVGSENQS